MGGGRRERDRAAARAAAAGQRRAGAGWAGDAGRPGPGARSPGRAARPARPARPRSSWSRCAASGCGSWPLTPGRTVLRLVRDRREELSRARAQALNRMHRLFTELIPGGAPVHKTHRLVPGTAGHGAAPGTPAGKTRRRMAAGEIADLEHLGATLKAMTAGLKAAVTASGSPLMDIHGTGPAGAARIPAGAGDAARFPARAHFASWTGTAPLDASSGQPTCHRLSRAGNRRLGHMLATWPASSSSATTPPAVPRTGAGPPRARLPGKRCAACGGACRRGLPPARRRRPGTNTKTNGPREGTPGRLCHPARPAFPPGTGPSGQPLPGPAPKTPPPPPAAKTPPAARTGARPRRRAGGDGVQRPARRTTPTPASAGAHSKSPGPPS